MSSVDRINNELAIEEILSQVDEIRKKRDEADEALGKKTAENFTEKTTVQKEAAANENDPSFFDVETFDENLLDDDIEDALYNPYAGKVHKEKSQTNDNSAEDTIKIYAPVKKSSRDQLEHTKVFSFVDESTGEQKKPNKKNDSIHAEQLQLDKLFFAKHDENNAEDIGFDDAISSAEREMHIERERKSEKFKKKFQLFGEEEENSENEEIDDFEDDLLEDYIDEQDAPDVRSGLAFKRRLSMVITAVTGVCAVLLILMNLFSDYNILGNTLIQLGGSLVLLLFILVINKKLISTGISSLLKRTPSAETAVAVPAVVVMVHTIFQFVYTLVKPDNVPIMFTQVIGVALFFAAFGKWCMTKRLSNNFRFVSYCENKYDICTIEDERIAYEIGRETVALGDPNVAFSKKTPFLTNFLKNSYSYDKNDKAAGKWVVFSLAVSLVVAVIYGFRSASPIVDGFTAFSASVCFSLLAASMITFHLHALRLGSKILRYGAMSIGWQAVNKTKNLDSIVIDARDLFPEEQVHLYGIKTFESARIDEAIVDAAAVVTAAGGPLSNLFLKIIQNDKQVLPEVDTLVYEQEMGVTGWVSGKRVLVGNRKLLDNHGVTVPSLDYEKKYSRRDRHIVYLSVAGELSAMFIVSYNTTDSIGDALYTLGKAKVTALIRTTDPNITEQFICDSYNIDNYYVEVMNAAQVRAFDAYAKQKKDVKTPAVLAYDGRVEGMIYAVAGSRRIGQASKLAIVLQLVGGAVGILLALVFLLFYSEIPNPNILLLYSAVCALLATFVPYIFII